jgi:dihydrofolate reductase / thymidylate synthase
MSSVSRRAFALVVAATRQLGIGKDGTLPWRLPSEMSYFRKLTSHISTPESDSTADPGPGPADSSQTDSKKNVVIMGRTTWESIPAKYRPLSNRINIVLTSDASRVQLSDSKANAPLRTAAGMDEALSMLDSDAELNATAANVFVIGGASVYNVAMGMPNCSHIFLTRVLKDIECDTFLQPIDPQQFDVRYTSSTNSADDIPYQFVVYERNQSSGSVNEVKGAPSQSISSTETPGPAASGGSFMSSFFSVTGVDDVSTSSGSSTGGAAMRADAPTLDAKMAVNHEELQYLQLVREIIDGGDERGDRTGVGTLAKFGCQMRFSLRDGTFPMLTTKRVFWRGLAEELLWFVAGSTNAKLLADKGIKIWNGNASREYLDSIGLTDREEFDLGPVYGFQWRHFGAKYVDMHTDYKGQGVDQLAQVIHAIKNNPTSRRIIMSAWNPADMKKMALPPCHMFCQFYVANGELSCQMYQRSCDMGLGVPFNIASYSLLTCMIAHVCGLKPGEFVHTMGDTHVYSNHVEPLREQLKREPRPFPKLRIKRTVDSIDDFTMDDFEIIGYKPHGPIKMRMAV